MEIFIVSGDAGTGKTYYLANFIHENINKKFVCLSFTHSALNNLYKSFTSLFPNDKLRKDHYFKTFHSYFNINPTNNKITKFIYDKLDYIIIDEYSLISIDLFDMVKDVINCDNLILCGDYKQLKTIDYNNMISYDKLNEYIDILGNLDNDKLEAIKHYANSIISLPYVIKHTKKITLLTKQQRNNNNVSNIINNICFNIKDTDDSNITNKFNVNSLFISLPTLYDKVINGYAVIASRYDYLQQIHNFVSLRKDYDVVINQHGLTSKYGLEKIYLSYGDKVIITENIKYGDDIINNGDELIFNEFSNNIMYLYDEYNDKAVVLCPIVKGAKTYNKIGMFKDNGNTCYAYFPILPANLITYHKSQGKTINDVILCVDNLFDFSMLYTGLSRAKRNILLFSFDNINDADKNNNDAGKLPKTSNIYDNINKLVNHYYQYHC